MDGPFATKVCVGDMSIKQAKAEMAKLNREERAARAAQAPTPDPEPEADPEPESPENATSEPETAPPAEPVDNDPEPDGGTDESAKESDSIELPLPSDTLVNANPEAFEKWRDEMTDAFETVVSNETTMFYNGDLHYLLWHCGEPLLLSQLGYSDVSTEAIKQLATHDGVEQLTGQWWGSCNGVDPRRAPLGNIHDDALSDVRENEKRGPPVLAARSTYRSSVRRVCGRGTLQRK